MKKVSLGLLALATVGFSVLPASAIEKKATSERVDASQQIQDAITPGYCTWIYLPGYGWICR